MFSELIPLTYPQIFITLGLLLMILELFIGIEAGFDLILIGSILIFSGIFGLITDSALIMLALAAVLSFLYIAIGRRQIQAKITTITHKTNIDKLPGAVGVVIRTITPDTPGMIRLNDEDWRAKSNQVLYEKDRVKVISLEGVTLNVTKADKK